MRIISGVNRGTKLFTLEGTRYTTSLAENIMAAAQKNAVPVYQNKTLVNMLMALEIDREIPPELYRTIEEVYDEE